MTKNHRVFWIWSLFGTLGIVAVVSWWLLRPPACAAWSSSESLAASQRVVTRLTLFVLEAERTPEIEVSKQGILDYFSRSDFVLLDKMSQCGIVLVNRTFLQDASSREEVVVWKMPGRVIVVNSDGKVSVQNNGELPAWASDPSAFFEFP